MIITIAAASENNVLGKDNELLWRLPNDFKRFKELTLNHYILMGRKTFESLGRPLPKRTHLIITRDEDYGKSLPENCHSFQSVEDALEFSKDQEDIYIIGGGEIYKQTMDIADRIELTRVYTEVEGDTYFPEIDNTWEVVGEVKEYKDENHPYDFAYITYEKRP